MLSRRPVLSDICEVEFYGKTCDGDIFSCGGRCVVVYFGVFSFYFSLPRSWRRSLSGFTSQMCDSSDAFTPVMRLGEANEMIILVLQHPPVSLFLSRLPVNVATKHHKEGTRALGQAGSEATSFPFLLSWNQARKKMDTGGWGVKPLSHRSSAFLLLSSVLQNRVSKISFLPDYFLLFKNNPVAFSPF